jgi:hypothetical protein
MNIFKISYKVVRENSKEIYKGFGFKHLSDATMYYVHPDNQSFKGTTTLCQPIGEAIILFANLLTNIINGTRKGFGDGNFFISDDKSKILIELVIPDDYHENDVIEKNIQWYGAFIENNNIKIAAYDFEGKLIEGDMEHLHPLYKLLPCFCVMLAREIEINSDFRAIMESFIENPVADTFVNLHEDLYQRYKSDFIKIEYTDLNSYDTRNMESFANRYKVIKENKEQMKEEKTIPIIAFKKNAFDSNQLAFVPKLSSEFVLPKNLNSMCNAISNGDILAILLHGPSGTGKTMSCKLICQAIGLPIMETINCTENLDEYVLGKFIPQDDKIIFKESYVTKAIRDGGAVVFEEINFAKPQYLAFLNSLLDDNGFVRLDNGDVVKRHKNFRFFATMNLGYFGTKELNQALYNRFNGIIEIAELSDEAISKMLVARVPECADVVDKILSVYHKLKKKIEAEELDVVISPRNLENWAKLAKYDGYISSAEKTIIPIAKCDRVLEETIRGIIVIYKWK